MEEKGRRTVIYDHQRMPPELEEIYQTDMGATVATDTQEMALRPSPQSGSDGDTEARRTTEVTAMYAPRKLHEDPLYRRVAVMEDGIGKILGKLYWTRCNPKLGCQPMLYHRQEKRPALS